MLALDITVLGRVSGLKMKDIVIIGAGGFGREVAWLIEEINLTRDEWNLIGFIDDDESTFGLELNGYKVLGNVNWLIDKSINVVCAIGNPIVKKSIINRIKNTENIFPTLIHPCVRYSNTVEFGVGTIVCIDTILTVNIKIGNHVIINLDCTIGHDAIINDYATILPSVNVSGHVNIGECVSVGTGSAIIQGVSIGSGSTLGAGAVVINNIPENCIAVGTPAKAIKFLDV